MFGLDLGVLLKNFAYIPAFMFGFLGDSNAAGILLALMVVDTVFGIISSAIVDGGQSIKSRIAIRGIIAKCMIFIIPSVLYWTGVGAGVDFKLIAEGMMSMIILAETYSIMGHIYTVNTGKRQTEFDAVTYILNKIQRMLRLLIEDDKKSK
jgi:phage-related holin